MGIISAINNYPLRQSVRQSVSSAADSIRISNYHKMQEMYHGGHWSYDRTDNEDLVTNNFCETFVDKNTSFIAGDTWSFDDDSDKVRPEIKDILFDIWKANDKQVKTYELCHEASLFGDSFLWVSHNEVEQTIKFSVVPPMYVYPKWHPEDRNVMLSAEIEFITDINDRDVNIKYVLDSIYETKFVDNKEVYKKAHMTGRVPLVHLKNKNVPAQWNGKSDIHSVIEIQKHYNEKLTDISDIISYHAAPMLIAYGVVLDTEDIEKGADKVISGLPMEAKVESIQFTSDLSATLDYMKLTKSQMHQLAHTPEIAFGSVDDLRFSNSSGLAIQMLYQPMLENHKVKKMYLERAIQEINQICLTIHQVVFLDGLVTDEDIESLNQMGISFPNPLPQDEALTIQNEKMKLEAGLTTHKKSLKRLGSEDPQNLADTINKEIESDANIPHRLKILEILKNKQQESTNENPSVERLGNDEDAEESTN